MKKEEVLEDEKRRRDVAMMIRTEEEGHRGIEEDNTRR